jgi:hypothetical protein
MSISIGATENSSVEPRLFKTQIGCMANQHLRTQLRQSRPDDGEPSLSDLIDDPVLRAVMARDGVGCADLVSAIDVARARLGLGPWADAPCGPAAVEASRLAACCG